MDYEYLDPNAWTIAALASSPRVRLRPITNTQGSPWHRLVTQQNAALVEQVAAAAQSLEDQASKLEIAVSSFKLADTTDFAVAIDL